MDGNIGYAHFGLEAVRLGDIAVARMNHQRRAKLAGVDDPLHLGIAAIISAHKANLYQSLALCALGLDDFLAIVCILRKWFFAENIFAVLETFQHISGVAWIGGSDQDRMHFGSCNQLLACCVSAQTFILRRSFAGSFLQIIRAGDDLTAGNQIMQATDMVAANSTAADYTNIQHSLFSPFWFGMDGKQRLSCLLSADSPRAVCSMHNGRKGGRKKAATERQPFSVYNNE